MDAAIRETREETGVTVRDQGDVRGGIVSFTVSDVEALRVKAALRAESINVTVSPARGTLLDMRARGLREILRASVHYYNTEAELDEFAAAIQALTP